MYFIAMSGRVVKMMRPSEMARFTRDNRTPFPLEKVFSIVNDFEKPTDAYAMRDIMQRQYPRIFDREYAKELIRSKKTKRS